MSCTAAGDKASPSTSLRRIRRKTAPSLILLVANLLLAFWVVKAAWNVIPLTATAIATIAMFRLDGLRLRYAILCCTLLWLINNILTGSIGGTVMESMNTIMSSITIYRLHSEIRLSRKPA